VLVSSGDGGWIHLAPSVAETLAANGFFVVGFDVKAYLESFTSGDATLRLEDVQRDYKSLADYAGQGSSTKPVLIGVSEGAGLSVLAATDQQTRGAVAGVLALGLPLLDELGWRWRDSLIYVTHRVPNEPTFNVGDFVGRLAPLPLAVVHSSHDEFAPVGQVQRVMAAAREPKGLWIVDASNHRFSGNVGEFNRRLLESLAWIKAHQPR
jgi:type IV secretory pathway VirJ component